MLVEVVGDRDPRVDRTQRVELGAHLAHHDAEIARVDPDGSQRRAGHAHRGLDTGRDVEGVDEQRRTDAHGLDLSAEGVLLRVEQQGEGVRGGPHGRDAPLAPGLQVAGGPEPGDVRGSGGRDR